MKATGIVRRIDDLGRVVIPKEIRQTREIEEGDPVEIYTGDNGEIILLKYHPALSCIFCGNDSATTHKGKEVCGDCIKELHSKF